MHRTKIWNEPTEQVLYSKILQEERSVSVYLPISYSRDNSEYPVLYHLDGDQIQLDEIIVVPEKLAPKVENLELIYVSIKNTDRTRDMSPIETSFCENPGADKFLGFLKAELIPHVDCNFQTSEFRILCGQSYSSVFTLYALLEEPSLFDGYITTSLYFPQCKEYFMKRATESFGKDDYDDRYLFMSRGELDFDFNKDNQTEIAIKELIGIIGNSTASGLVWEYKVYASHGHCPEPSHGDGLNWILQQIAG
jgi:predicted alpha/beta superfamily hydrolase